MLTSACSVAAIAYQYKIFPTHVHCVNISECSSLHCLSRHMQLIENFMLYMFNFLNISITYSIMSVIENPAAYLNETNQVSYDEPTPLTKPGQLRCTLQFDRWFFNLQKF